MELRRVLLRILLIALALAALAGVVGVITAAGETIWRIVATAITTAVAVGIMLPFSMMMDKPKSRAGGTSGLVWTVVAYVLLVVLIWWNYAYGYRLQDSLALTLLSWTLSGLPAVLLLSLMAIPQARVAARAGVALAGVTFCLLLVWSWHWTMFVAAANRWAGSGIAVGTLGALAVINLVHAGTGDRRWWRWIGVIAAGGAWLLVEANILQPSNWPPGKQVFTGLTSLAAVLGLANLALLVPLVGMQAWVRWGTITAAAACAGAINVLVYLKNAPWEEEFWGRLAAGCGIVAGCGSLALLVLARINRRVEYHPQDGAVLTADIAVVCPRCRKSQKIKLGGDTCRTCGLRIEITIEEPRCPKCGYLVYMLASPICPECGNPIAGQAAPNGLGQHL